MKVTYWYSRCPHDNNCYSVRERTKRDAQKSIAEAYRPESWPKPMKVQVQYNGAFDLVEQLLGEGGVEPYQY